MLQWLPWVHGAANKKAGPPGAEVFTTADIHQVLELPCIVRDQGPWTFEEVEDLLALPSRISRASPHELRSTLHAAVCDLVLCRLHYGWLWRLQGPSSASVSWLPASPVQASSKPAVPVTVMHCCAEGRLDAWQGGLWQLLLQVLRSICTCSVRTGCTGKLRRSLLISLADRMVAAVLAVLAGAQCHRATTDARDDAGTSPAPHVAALLRESSHVAQRLMDSFTLRCLDSSVDGALSSDAAAREGAVLSALRHWMGPRSAAKADSDEPLQGPSTHTQTIVDLPDYMEHIFASLLLSSSTWLGLTLASSCSSSPSASLRAASFLNYFVTFTFDGNNAHCHSEDDRRACELGIFRECARALVLADSLARQHTLLCISRLAPHLLEQLSTSAIRSTPENTRSQISNTCLWAMVTLAGPCMPPATMPHAIDAVWNTTVNPIHDHVLWQDEEGWRTRGRAAARSWIMSHPSPPELSASGNVSLGWMAFGGYLTSNPPRFSSRCAFMRPEAEVEPGSAAAFRFLDLLRREHWHVMPSAVVSDDDLMREKRHSLFHHVAEGIARRCRLSSAATAGRDHIAASLSTSALLLFQFLLESNSGSVRFPVLYRDTIDEITKHVAAAVKRFRSGDVTDELTLGVMHDVLMGTITHHLGSLLHEQRILWTSMLQGYCDALYADCYESVVLLTTRRVVDEESGAAIQLLKRTQFMLMELLPQARRACLTVNMDPFGGGCDDKVATVRVAFILVERLCRLIGCVTIHQSHCHTTVSRWFTGCVNSVQSSATSATPLCFDPKPCSVATLEDSVAGLAVMLLKVVCSDAGKQLRALSTDPPLVLDLLGRFTSKGVAEGWWGSSARDALPSWVWVSGVLDAVIQDFLLPVCQDLSGAMSTTLTVLEMPISHLWVLSRLLRFSWDSAAARKNSLRWIPWHGVASDSIDPISSVAESIVSLANNLVAHSELETWSCAAAATFRRDLYFMATCTASERRALMALLHVFAAHSRRQSAVQGEKGRLVSTHHLWPLLVTLSSWISPQPATATETMWLGDGSETKRNWLTACAAHI